MREDPVRQCVVLAGQFAGGATSAALLPCGDRPALAWVLREFVRFGVDRFLLLTDDASEAFGAAIGAVAAGLPRAASVAIAPVDPAAGTAGAVLSVSDRLDRDFLLCRGDVLFDCNLAGLLAVNDPAAVAHLLVPAADGAAAVIGRFSRRVLASLHPGQSLKRDLLPQLAAAGTLRRLAVAGAFGNLAVPAQAMTARQAFPDRLRRPALFLDRDGVLNVDHGWVGTRERFEWMPGALDAIRCATEAGWHVFVVTNQSGVARGHYDEAAVRSLLGWMAEEARRAGGTIDDARYCPFHEDAVVPAYRGAHPWRKPQPGMLLDLIRAWELEPARCRMVGDQASDMQAAAAACVAGHLFPGGDLLEFVRPLLRGHAGWVPRAMP